MKIRSRQFLLATLVVVMALAGVASGAPVAFTNEALSDTTSVEFEPETSGAHVVWTSYFPPTMSDSRVMVHNLATGITNTIGGGDGRNQLNPDVSLGRIAYEHMEGLNSDVKIWDSVLNVTLLAAIAADDEVAPRIDGNLVVWHRPTLGELWYRDLVRGIGGMVPDANSVEYFDVDNGRIVWSEANTSDAIYFYEPGVSTEPHFVRNLSTTSDITSLQVHGDRIAFTEFDGAQSDAKYQDLYGWWSDEAAEGSDEYEEEPSIFHKDLLWDSYASGSHDIMFRPAGGDESAVAIGPKPQYGASMFGRRIAYAEEPGMFNADIWIASADQEIARTAGDDRYLTAVETSKAYFDGAENAVLCTGRNFPDALAATPLARVLHAPLLLTRADAVDAATMAEFDRLGVQDVYVIGGADVVSNDVMTQLGGAGMTAHRIYGDDRYATSVKIAEEMDARLASPYPVYRAFFARGDNFPDALAVGPVAAAAHSPIILVRPGAVPVSVSDAVNELDLTSGVIVGGSDVVSNDVRDELRTLMLANGGDEMDPQIVERWSGDTRYDTAVSIVEHALEARMIDLDTLGVATGLNFPDALGGGAALGCYGSPLLLTKTSEVPAGVMAFLGEHEYEIGRLDVFGGSDVVSDGVKSAIAATLK